MSPFTQYKQWMEDRYGAPLFRVPVEIASSCPHGRCSFCTETGARAQQTQKQESPLEQAEEAIRFAKRRYRAKKFMLYIQAFTTDLTDPEQQHIIFKCLEPTALGHRFEAISISTRPDCLPPKALDFLEKLKEQIEVWVELGVQTSNDETLKRINRGHDWACSKQAILDLAERNIHVAPHVIIGLPGEISNHWKQAEPAPTNFSNAWNRTAEELAKLPISGIKIHNLHVVKGTELANDPPPTLNHWEYAEALMEFLQRIPADVPVMRISTDTPADELIAPRWHLEKGQFLDYLLRQMEMREICQGDLIGRDGCPQPSADASERRPYPVVPTEDGSITFFSNDWKEHYHDKGGARLEAQKKYIEPSGLATRLQTGDVQLLDVCFGLGVNSLSAIEVAEKADHQLSITALELDKRIVRATAKQTDSAVLNKLLDQNQETSGNHQLGIQWGDARYRIQQINDQSFDLVFHDPFSTQHCPELWTVEFFQQLNRVIKPDGLLLTYSSSQPVRSAMLEAGFYVAETVPGHHMGNGTIASKQKEALIQFPNIGTLDKRRSIPYRDEFLCASSKTILRRRQESIESF